MNSQRQSSVHLLGLGVLAVSKLHEKESHQRASDVLYSPDLSSIY